MQIKSLVFSPFSVNTYIVFDQTGECVIIDPACYDKSEENALINFVETNKLKPVRLINTHCHLDHVFGNKFVAEHYGLLPEAHKEEVANNDMSPQAAKLYNLSMNTPPPINKFIDENDTITFGNSELTIRYVPGHTAGSLAFYNANDNWIIGGDVLFKNSIGRTDLPGGDYNTLIKSIIEQLFSLPEDTQVLPGHGLPTSIGYEIRSNPFIEL